MDVQTGLTFLAVFTIVMVIWFLLGWAIYGGDRGKSRKGGLFWAIYRFVVIPWLITSAISLVFFGVVWGFMAATGSFN